MARRRGRKRSSRNRPRYRSRRRRRLSTFQKLHRFCRRHPVISAGGSVVIAIILLRAFFSDNLFGNNITEFRMWVFFASMVFFFIGIIAFMIWVRRNVPQIHTKHDVGVRWRNR